MDSDMVKTLVRLIEEANGELSSVSDGSVSLAVVGGIEADYQNNDLTTVLVKMDEDAEFMAYSTTNPTSLKAYLKGLVHALKMVNGSYAFRPNNDAAASRRRVSISPWREMAKKYQLGRVASAASVTSPAAPQKKGSLPEYGMPKAKARTSARFAGWRTRFCNEGA